MAYFSSCFSLTRRTKKIKIMSPDSGGLSRCERFRLALLKRLKTLGVNLDDIEIVVFDKLRIKGEVKGGRIIGDVEDADVIAFGGFLREINSGRSIDCLPQGLYPCKMIGSDFFRFIDNSSRLKPALQIRGRRTATHRAYNC